MVFVIFLSHNAFSQNFILEGRVTTTKDIDVEGINIFNLTTSKGTITDEDGAFWISVSLKDTLSISALHIQKTTLIIEEAQLIDKKIIIELNEKMNELSTVTIRRPLTGYLSSDANIIPVQKSVTASSVRLPNADLKKLPKTERLLYTANSTPVDALLNMISGRTKMLKKQIEMERKTQLSQTLLDKFPETYFTSVLQIDRFKIYSFVFFCEDDPDYKNVMKSNNEEIRNFLERKSIEFRKSLNEED